jgi:hypothetical protein
MDIKFSHHLQDLFNLNEDQVKQITDEFIAFFSETAEDYIRRRHNEMKADSMKNDEIYKILKSEISKRRFASAGLTERQIRRIIYG